MLAAGLAVSYAILGTGLAWAGAALGWDTFALRDLGAVVLGLVLLSGRLQQRFTLATSGLGDVGNRWMARMRLDGVWGQGVIGVVLGIVWSPCVGPTLGAAIVLPAKVRMCRKWHC